MTGNGNTNIATNAIIPNGRNEFAALGANDKKLFFCASCIGHPLNDSQINDN